MNFVDGYGLYRLDVETGKVSTWLGYTGNAYSFAFSPDDNYLAYNSDVDSNYLHILNLEEGTSEKLMIPDVLKWAAKLLWSPDSSKMAFVTMHDQWCCNDNKNMNVSSLFLYNAKTNTITQLLPGSSRLLYPVEWISETRIMLHDYWNVIDFIFDVSAKNLVGTPTP